MPRCSFASSECWFVCRRRRGVWCLRRACSSSARCSPVALGGRRLDQLRDYFHGPLSWPPLWSKTSSSRSLARRCTSQPVRYSKQDN
eukprot:2309049-Lingulodinium_polyedra.AAC.1